MNNHDFLVGDVVCYEYISSATFIDKVVGIDVNIVILENLGQRYHFHVRRLHLLERVVYDLKRSNVNDNA